jgi:hypothetical protein
MQLSLKTLRSHILSRLAVAAITLSIASATHAAESAFIQQAVPGTTTKLTIPDSAIGQSTSFLGSNTQFSFTPTPEQTVPHGATAANFAQTLTVGNFNTVAQVQSGRNDLSSVAVLDGNRNNVGVVQNGNNLTSNLALLGLQATNVALVQGPNSPPVSLLIARLPNGSIVIK